MSVEHRIVATIVEFKVSVPKNQPDGAVNFKIVSELSKIGYRKVRISNVTETVWNKDVGVEVEIPYKSQEDVDKRIDAIKSVLEDVKRDLEEMSKIHEYLDFVKGTLRDVLAKEGIDYL